MLNDNKNLPKIQQKEKSEKKCLKREESKNFMLKREIKLKQNNNKTKRKKRKTEKHLFQTTIICDFNT